MNILTAQQWKQERAIRRMKKVDVSFDRLVLNIIDTVRTEGDIALKRYTKQFDGVSIDALTVSKEEMEHATELVSPTFLQALREAKKRIETFHQVQKEKSWFVQQAEGVILGQQVTPIERVGIYIPGGKAAYPSTVLMNAIPAKLAGVSQIVMVTPPQQDGSVNPAVLVAAKEAGVDVIYKVGGAQAIAALAYGTETIDRVMKITGPGNAFVARAKKWVYGDVAIDMIAGPSEICILADEQTNISYAAADLLSQAEHDEQAAAICVTTSEAFAHSLQIEVDRQLSQLDRKKIAQQSIAQNGRIILVTSLQEAIELINELAPEHLQLMVEGATELVPRIKNAGAIFIGPYTPEALGDYIAGPNHTLPTNGTAAFASPLGVDDFMKRSSIVHYTKEAFSSVADAVVELAHTEQLTGHAQAIIVRKAEKK